MFLFSLSIHLSVVTARPQSNDPGPWSPDTVRPPILLTARNRCQRQQPLLCGCGSYDPLRSQKARTPFIYGHGTQTLSAALTGHPRRLENHSGCDSSYRFPFPNDSLVLLRKCLLQLVLHLLSSWCVPNDDITSDYNRTDITNNTNCNTMLLCLSFCKYVF